jgi:hypothetical protein
VHVSGERPAEEGGEETISFNGPDQWKPGKNEPMFKYNFYVSVARRPCQKVVFEKAFPL